MSVSKFLTPPSHLACAAGLGFLAGILLPASATTAATITNLDTVQHTVVISSDDTTTNVTIVPNQKLEGVCPASCIVGMSPDSEQYEISANENITIEAGEFVFQTDDDTTGDDAGDDSDGDPVEDPAPEPDSETGE